MNLLCACPLLAALLLFVDLTLANNYAIVLDTSENMKGNRLTAVRQVSLFHFGNTLDPV